LFNAEFFAQPEHSREAEHRHENAACATSDAKRIPSYHNRLVVLVEGGFLS